MSGAGRRPPGGRTSFDDELYSFERWRSEQGLRSAGLDGLPSSEAAAERREPVTPPISSTVTSMSADENRRRDAGEETSYESRDLHRRLEEHEARLRREWETLRALYEQPLQRLQERYLPALESYAQAMADHQQQLAQAQLRIDSLEHRVSGEFATASRNLHEVATIIRDLTAIRDRANDAASTVALDLPIAPPGRRRFSASMLLLVFASILIPIALVAGGLFLYSRVSDLARRTELAEQGLGNAAARMERVTNVLIAPDVRTFALGAGPAAPQASGQALWSPTRGVVLAGAALPPAPTGQTYQAWLLTDGGAAGLGPVTPDAAGRVTVIFDPAPATGPVLGAMVTLEPQGDSRIPTGLGALIP